MDVSSHRITLPPESERRIALAQRVADAHRGIDDASLTSFVSGSTVDGWADDRSDVDMSVLFATLPEESVLREACRRAGGDWFWQQGSVEEGLVVAFRLDGIEVQIGYQHLAGFENDLDDLLLRHNPDTPNHKLAEGTLKALPLAGASRLEAWQRRLAVFPDELALAMVRHGLKPSISWRGMAQLVHRDTALWCRDLQVDACYRLLLILSGINRRYFTRFQVKRVHPLTARFSIAPRELADRIEALLALPPKAAFDALFALEGEVLELVAAHEPAVDLATAWQRREAWSAAGG